MEAYWEEKVKIPAYIADHTDHLDIWGMARITQESADHHTAALGCGFTDMIAKNYAWVLARMYYNINQMPAVGEEVLIRTWSRGCDGLQFYRDFEIIDKDHKILVTATTVWVVINYSNRKLCRMQELGAEIQHYERCATDISNLRRLKVPEMTSSDYVKYVPVEQSMIDHNSHMNNAEYLRVIFDALADLNLSREGLSFEINYLNETNYGDTIKINRVVDDNSAILMLSNSNGASVTCKVNFPQ